MKNIFKLMGLALIAGSLAFVSCSKDDDDAITVNYDGTEWTTNDVYVMNYGDHLIGSMYKNINNVDSPNASFRCGTKAERYDFTGESWAAYDEGDGIDIISTQNGHMTVSDINIDNRTISAEIDTEMGTVDSGKKMTVSINDATWTTPTAE